MQRGHAVCWHSKAIWDRWRWYIERCLAFQALCHWSGCRNEHIIQGDEEAQAHRWALQDYEEYRIHQGHVQLEPRGSQVRRSVHQDGLWDQRLGQEGCERRSSRWSVPSNIWRQNSEERRDIPQNLVCSRYPQVLQPHYCLRPHTTAENSCWAPKSARYWIGNQKRLRVPDPRRTRRPWARRKSLRSSTSSKGHHLCSAFQIKGESLGLQRRHSRWQEKVDQPPRSSEPPHQETVQEDVHERRRQEDLFNGLETRSTGEGRHQRKESERESKAEGKESRRASSHGQERSSLQRK